MQTRNKIKSVWKKLRFSYKLTIFNEHTLEQVLMFRISRLTVILSMLIAVLIIGALTIYLITRTPLRRTLPGYVSPEMRSQIVDNALAVDSLARIVNINKAYLDNLANIFSGNIPLDSIDINSEQTLQTYSIDSLLPASNATNSFLRKYAEEGKYTLDVFNQNVADNLIFYPPVKGRVTQTYNPQRRIFGIRITPPRQSPVAAVLDGTVIAQLGVPDMGLPIQYALTYPERRPSRSDRLDFTAYPGGLHFYAPDLEALPCLARAMRCARTGGTAPTVMNAANEVAVHLFLDHKIGYHSIYESVAAAVEAIAPVTAPDLDVIRAADQEARAFVRSYFHF